ncbi:MAG: T9SS type A sorting domain-containing protein, partial [bacterium]
AAPLVDRTHRGGRVVFEIAALRLSDDPDAPREIEFDAGDGLGFRTVRPGGRVTAEYRSEGRKTARVRVTTAKAETRRAGFSFDVLRLGTPAPDDTLAITATIPHQGELGTGSAYVLLAPGHAQVENPAIVFEGFDLDNGMHWEELYALLNQQSLLESLGALGFDAVVLDFTDATAPIQENAFVGLELLLQMQAASGNGGLVLVGASMGGLVARYALAYAEAHAIDHDVRTFVSFDVPHRGAVIPLGIQYWVDFFSGESADAAALLAALDSPAARQMLLYHHTTPPGATGEPDPEHAAFLADLAALGDWPASPRLAGVANGTGSQANQGFLPGAQIIRWEYDSFLVDVIGNVWAVPNGASQTIFRGMIDFLGLPPDTVTVVVSGTAPWDGAPGGWRGSMAQMDTVQAPFGDIVALHDNHCFIPTISALALDHTTDPFHDVDGDPELPAHTPFDALLVQTTNEEHVFVNAVTAQWLLDEIVGAVTGVGPTVAAARTPSLLPNAPNPFRAGTTISFSLAEPAPVSLRIYDVQGRLVARLLDAEPRAAGSHSLAWRPESGAGVYFVRLETPHGSASRKLLRVP